MQQLYLFALAVADKVCWLNKALQVSPLTTNRCFKTCHISHLLIKSYILSWQEVFPITLPSILPFQVHPLALLNWINCFSKPFCLLITIYLYQYKFLLFSGCCFIYMFAFAKAKASTKCQLSLLNFLFIEVSLLLSYLGRHCMSCTCLSSLYFSDFQLKNQLVYLDQSCSYVTENKMFYIVCSIITENNYFFSFMFLVIVD